MNGESDKMPERDCLYIRAVRRRPVDRTPIWIMRQAGRYLPEYEKIRSRHDFLEVCKTPELATEVTLQPIRRFGFDAAILFSDILVIPEALGQRLEFLRDHGPRLSPPVRGERDVATLSPDGLEDRLRYVAEAVRMIRRELDGGTPLIGFSGSPLTLATYMIEGAPTRNFKFVKQMLYSEPERLTRLLGVLAEAVSGYLRMQVSAGVDAVQIFDTWGGILPPHLYEKYSAAYMRPVVDALKPTGVPVTVFGKGGIALLRTLSGIKADVLGVDWMTDLSAAKQMIGDSFAIQGNLDPSVLYGSRDIIRRETDKILDVFGALSGHVFNLGHGILPDIPVENVGFLVDYVRERSEALHSANGP
jgi:uroporphyrinogen decarboxylase